MTSVCRVVRATGVAALLSAASLASGACRDARVTALDPPVVAARRTSHILVRGVGFEAPLEAAVGTAPRRPLFVARPTLAMLDVEDMAPGHYDVVLYRDGREVSRLAGALTVDRAPGEIPWRANPAVQVVGTLDRLTPRLSRRLDQTIGVTSSRGVTILTLGAEQAVRAHGAVRRRVVMRVPLERSCWNVPLARMISVPTPLVVRRDGSRLPRCLDAAVNFEVGDRRLERDATVTLTTSEGPAALSVEAIRADDAAAGLPPRDRARLLATLDDEGQTLSAFGAGASLYLSPLRRLGTVVSSFRTSTGAVRLVIDVRCAPGAGRCTVPEDASYPPLPLTAGATVPILVGDRTHRLQVASIHALDEPIRAERTP